MAGCVTLGRLSHKHLLVIAFKTRSSGQRS